MWVAVGVIGGALIASEASGDATDKSLAGVDSANALEREMYYKGREDVAPWRDAGVGGLNYLQNYLGIGDRTQAPGMPQPEDFADRAQYENALAEYNVRNQQYQDQYGSYADLSASAYEQSPYYNFLQEEGTNALANIASAGGRTRSGAQDKALMRFGQNLASTDYNNWLGNKMQMLAPYQSMAGMGQTTAGQMGQNSMGLGTSLANNAMYAGGAQAQNAINQGNIWGNALTGLGNIGMTYAMNSRQQPSYTAGDYSNVGIY